LCKFVKEKRTIKQLAYSSPKNTIPLLLQYYLKKLNMKPDLFQSPDYYNLDDLLTDEAQISA
jgi:hypothetical protein